MRESTDDLKKDLWGKVQACINMYTLFYRYQAEMGIIDGKIAYSFDLHVFPFGFFETLRNIQSTNDFELYTDGIKTFFKFRNDEVVEFEGKIDVPQLFYLFKEGILEDFVKEDDYWYNGIQEHSKHPLKSINKPTGSYIFCPICGSGNLVVFDEDNRCGGDNVCVTCNDCKNKSLWKQSLSRGVRTKWDEQKGG